MTKVVIKGCTVPNLSRIRIGSIVLPRMLFAEFPEELVGAIGLRTVQFHTRNIHAKTPPLAELHELPRLRFLDQDERVFGAPMEQSYEGIVDAPLGVTLAHARELLCSIIALAYAALGSRICDSLGRTR